MKTTPLARIHWLDAHLAGGVCILVSKGGKLGFIPASLADTVDCPFYEANNETAMLQACADDKMEQECRIEEAVEEATRPPAPQAREGVRPFLV